MERLENIAENIILVAPGLEGSDGKRLKSMLADYQFKNRIVHVDQLNSLDLKMDKVLFAIPLSAEGVNEDYYKLIARLRKKQIDMKGAVSAIIVDGASQLYTKSVARHLVFAADYCGSWFIGGSLVDATGELETFRLRAKLKGISTKQVYAERIKDHIEKLVSFETIPISNKKSKLFVIESNSSRNAARSNTLLLWNMVKEKLSPSVEIKEISLENGTITDCRGCPHETCLHYSERNSCYYGGQVVSEIYPGILEADAILFLSPNYNDAVVANITATLNRLTALVKTKELSRKQVYAIVVSGYSGSDIVAEQLLGTMNMNKNFILPASFALMATANDPEEVLGLPKIEQIAENYAREISSNLKCEIAVKTT